MTTLQTFKRRFFENLIEANSIERFFSPDDAFSSRQQIGHGSKKVFIHFSRRLVHIFPFKLVFFSKAEATSIEKTSYFFVEMLDYFKLD